jgi:hypothetical protein
MVIRHINLDFYAVFFAGGNNNKIKNSAPYGCAVFVYGSKSLAIYLITQIQFCPDIFWTFIR